MKSHLPPRAQEDRLFAQGLTDDLAIYDPHCRKARRKNVLAPLFVLMAILMSTPAWAADIEVSTDADYNPADTALVGSLRWAIATANPGDTIKFKDTVTTVTLTSGELFIARI
jgi:hypothetical protein